MNLDITEVARFLGLPAQNADFDKYLTAHGISYRPIFEGTPVDRINVVEKGISLLFDMKDVYETAIGTPREDGEMIFRSLQAYGAVNDSGFNKYSGPLPYNLSFETKLEEAINIFGPPTLNHPSGPNRVYLWYGYHGTTIALCFLPEDKGLSFFSMENDSKEPPEPFDW